MLALQYFPDADPLTIEKEIFEMCHKAQTIITLPTFFIYEGCNEYKMASLYYPTKLSDLIRNNLACMSEYVADHNAVVLFHEGYTFVFFGSNQQQLEIPEVYKAKVEGSC